MLDGKGGVHPNRFSSGTLSDSKLTLNMGSLYLSLHTAGEKTMVLALLPLGDANSSHLDLTTLSHPAVGMLAPPHREAVCEIP